MKKVYGMPGKVDAQIVLTSPSGKTRYKIHFTGGSVNDRNKVDAKYITDSPIIQDVIERSPMFNRSIFLRNTFGETERQMAAANAAPAPAKGNGRQSGKVKETPKKEEPKLIVMDDITGIGDAIGVLMTAGEVTADEVASLEGVLKKAAELGYAFPNLKEEE